MGENVSRGVYIMLFLASHPQEERGEYSHIFDCEALCKKGESFWKKIQEL